MSVQDDLKVLVEDVYPEIVANLNIMLDKLDEQQILLGNEITTITDGVMGGATTDHLAALEAKRVANGWAHVQTYGQYGVDNLTDWQIWQFNFSPSPATFLTVDGFQVNFIISPGIGSPILAQPGSIQRIVLNFAWGPAPIPPAPPAYTYTNVALTPGTALPGGLTTVDFSSIIYSPTVNWDNDTNISDHQDAFLVAKDQLEAPIDTNGTYGLEERENQVDLGILVQTNNRDKYQLFIDTYGPYTS